MSQNMSQSDKLKQTKK